MGFPRYPRSLRAAAAAAFRPSARSSAAQQRAPIPGEHPLPRSPPFVASPIARRRCAAQSLVLPWNSTGALQCPEVCRPGIISGVVASTDTLGFEPRAFRMRSGCDATTPCALLLANARVSQRSLRAWQMKGVAWKQTGRSHARGGARFSAPAFKTAQPLHQSGIEPGSHRWQRCILPRDH